LQRAEFALSEKAFGRGAQVQGYVEGNDKRHGEAKPDGHVLLCLRLAKTSFGLFYETRFNVRFGLLASLSD
jgi:hypothetical protein